jgi:hypothetical protein
MRTARHLVLGHIEYSSAVPLILYIAFINNISWRFDIIELETSEKFIFHSNQMFSALPPPHYIHVVGRKCIMKCVILCLPHGDRRNACLICFCFLSCSQLFHFRTHHKVTIARLPLSPLSTFRLENMNLFRSRANRCRYRPYGRPQKLT